MRRPTVLLSSLLLLLPTVTAHASQYRDLCPSVPVACEWSGPDTPTLAADVCFSSTAGTRLMGSSACPSGWLPFFVDYGEVIDPITNAVQAYVPLNDACTIAGVCVDGPPPPGAQEEAICCEWGTCVPLGEVTCNSSNSVALYCYDGVTESDGSVTCYEGEPL